MAEWKNTDERELLAAVMAFYKQALNLPDDSIIPTTEPMTAPEFPPGGDFWISVAIGDGVFPDEEQDDECLHEQLELLVTGYTRMQLDQKDRDHQFLFHPTAGACAIKSKLLLIVGKQLVDPAGKGIVASRVYARGSRKPGYDVEQAVGWRTMVFGLDFDWGLPDAEDQGDD